MPFKDVPSRYDGPQLEGRILKFWAAQKVFDKTLRHSSGRPLFTFNEGPPTANGRPGLHHVLARTFKDVFPRYKTMRGFHAPRKAGWDTHGLPVEHEVEKELGIFDKKRIEQEVGVAEFTRRCRESVMRYIGAWERMTERMGFWVDLKHAYYTLDNPFIESVWHLLKVIWDRGLIYQDYKVVPYDPRIGATLSSHEVALGYREVDDPSVHVRFPVRGEEKTSLLVWTTTPWTLPSNCAVAVNPDVRYAWVETGGETLILAEERVAAVLGDEPRQIRKTAPGRDLAGLRYARPFEYLQTPHDIARVLPAAFVSTEDGTGLVHIAPAYGADDLELGKADGLPVLHGVGLDGCFLPDVTPVAGKFFKDADPVLTRELKERGLLFRSGRMRHNYPFGWRTGDPLIYYAKNAWYIRTSAVKERMVALNRTINWVPETIKEGRFGNWLENNVDWALSRERFWGTPLPVWTDGEGAFHCIGSVAELEALAGRRLDQLDLHRPAIDEVTFQHPVSGKTMRRVPEVIDCWFDSGAMSYAQWHWPFENDAVFRRHFPADFICEAIDQTRGWFYTLHAIATLVSDSVAFRNVICLSHLVDKDGKKMSKSQGNIVNPDDVFETAGADPLRWHFLARVAPDAQKRVSLDIVSDVAGTFLNTVWNTYAFFVSYAKLDRVDLARNVPYSQRPEIDRWVLALLQGTIARATEALDAYDTKTAGEAIEAFVEQLSNWYVRRNRRRFWKSEAGADKQAAYLTLYECLVTVNRLMAPFMPFLAEEVHQNLVRGAGRGALLSVHMDAWPAVNPALVNDALVAEVETVQRVVSLARAARADSKLKVRQPLAKVLVRVPQDSVQAIRTHRDQIIDELNVKELEFISPNDSYVNYRIKPNLPVFGKKHGKLIPELKDILENRLLDVQRTDLVKSLEIHDHFDLQLGGQMVTILKEDVVIEPVGKLGYACSEAGGYLVALVTNITPALEREGLAREIVRSIQDARKQAGLAVSDRIRLYVGGSASLQRALFEHQEYVLQETLAVGFAASAKGADYAAERDVDGAKLAIALTRAKK
jgi:isoleucyl-tRNA synthetase